MTRTVARALGYLTLRVVVNSLRRAFANPLRAILTTLVLAFVLCGWGGALLGSLMETPAARARPDLFQPQQLMLRSLGLVVLIHWFYVVFMVIPSVLRPAYALVQESDVHYLFTTPLKPLTLFRGMILIRGMFTALFFLMVLTVYLLLFGGARLRLLSTMQEPAAPAIALLCYPILYLLVFSASLLWSIALEAMEITGRSVRRWVLRALVGWAVLSFVLTAGYLVYLRRMPEEFAFLTALGKAVDWLPAYVLLLPVRGLADAAIVLYQGVTPAMGVSFALWLAGVLLANWALARHQDALYEVGASLARKGAAARASQRDPMGTYLQRKAETASAKPLRTLRWLERWTPRGVWALLWRDLLITWRASGWGNLLMVALMAAAPVGLALLIHYTAPAERDVRLALKIAYAVAQAMTAFFISFGAFYGFTDMLRRVEWQKPLPFSPRAVMVVESLPSVVFLPRRSCLPRWSSACGSPATGSSGWAAVWQRPAWATVLMMAMLAIALINPDPTDYTQRLLSGVLIVPALLLTGAPGAAIWFLGVGLQWNLWLMVGLSCLTNLFAAFALTAFNGALYEKFSPID
jgi:hypothetical protein